MWLLFETGDKSARILQGHVEIVHSEKQQETIAGCSVLGTHQGWVLMGTPLVQAEQHRSIGIEDLTKKGMSRSGRRLSEERLIPLKTPGHVAHSDDCPRALHDVIVPA